jgi:hypothetical protein
LIGARTIQQLRREKILDPAYRVKIGRDEVRRLIAKSVVLYPFAGAWKSQFPTAACLRK